MAHKVVCYGIAEGLQSTNAYTCVAGRLQTCDCIVRFAYATDALNFDVQDSPALEITKCCTLHAVMRCSCMQANGVPILTFHTGTADFCKLTSPFELTLLILFHGLVTAVCLASPTTIDQLNYFGFYKYDWHFRLRCGAIGIGTAAVWLLILFVLRDCVERFEARQKATACGTSLTLERRFSSVAIITSLPAGMHPAARLLTA